MKRSVNFNQSKELESFLLEADMVVYTSLSFLGGLLSRKLDVELDSFFQAVADPSPPSTLPQPTQQPSPSSSSSSTIHPSPPSVASTVPPSPSSSAPSFGEDTDGLWVTLLMQLPMN